LTFKLGIRVRNCAHMLIGHVSHATNDHCNKSSCESLVCIVSERIIRSLYNGWNEVFSYSGGQFISIF